MTRALLVLALAVTWLSADDAAAYPQLQLSYDQTCSSCHVSPAGGNLLNENGLAVAESMSQLGTAPEFFYGKVGGPKWLQLGGDIRIASGYLQTPSKALVTIPMQIEAYAAATFGAFSIHANVGPRPTTRGNEAATSVWAREHYLMWKSNPDDHLGLFVRAGRFMPVYGLRLAEHPTYVRRYGGTPLYADTYGLHAAVVQAKFEAHVTGFIQDPLIDTVSKDSGAYAYGEYRLTETLAVGAEGMFTHSADDLKFGGGGVLKAYLPSKNLLFQAEVQFQQQLIHTSSLNEAGGAPQRLIGYLLATWQPKRFLMIDLGLGHYDSNLLVKDLDRDCVDLNIHWFATSHLELILTNRYEMLAFGNGGPSGAYSLLQVHYRL
ncbi:MAG: hypothetical protein JNL83_37685 [Myxococcales bacterium]|nr:hypothetical protein [Myxococcales bacterium]